MGSGSVRKEEPWEMGNPVRGSTTGCEGGFEPSVDSFDNSVRLGMKSCGVDVRNLQEGR
jgi:hypothetical protein